MFVELFGNSVRLTRANLVKAAKANLDLTWLTSQRTGLASVLYISCDEGWNEIWEKACEFKYGKARNIAYANGLADHWGLK